jgi:CheY-like chemotaxis protein
VPGGRGPAYTHGVPHDPSSNGELEFSIRELRNRNEELTKLNLELMARAERKDQFMAMLGHELRHPLTPITHATYLLRQLHQDPGSSELLDTIDGQTQTILRFVNELLDLWRITHGSIEIRRRRLDVAALARDAVEALRPMIEDRQHDLSLVLPAAPLYVRGDSDRLRQVVNNLVENAAKYTGPGGRITVTLEQSGENAVLAIRDSGIGIDDRHLERIFQAFTQSEQLLTGPSSGLGIGLTMARRIVELHGGTVTVTSGGASTGSEFVVTLPVSLGEAPNDRPVVNASTAPGEVTTRARRVLVVDDHAEVRASVSNLARRWGHEVADAADGLSALSVAETFLPECAILDLSMPGMDGIELARRLRRRFPREQLTLIALSGFAEREIRDGCLAAGFDAFVIKPGEIAELQRLIGGDRQA